ncbi:MAG TPA: ferrous iron transport protein A [Rhodospirillaceae bacterium]|nr:ferrous iron transport protein A [Rhodospirillaceae bacterium]
MTLADVPRGQRALVQRIASDDTQFRQRLQSMGVVKGTAVVVDHTAPLGDPRVYSLMGYSLTLRNSEARHILVSLQ